VQRKKQIRKQAEEEVTVSPRESEPLNPELREAESLMEQALDEACDTDAPSAVDTGELIRVEGMLEIATDAAKQAIALRQRRREARSPGSTRGAGALGAAEAAATERAAHRTFTDEHGVTWDVYAVYPEAELSSKLRGAFQRGWLCFDSGPEIRRLSPIPENWQELAAKELEQLAGRAERARPRGARRAAGDQEPGQSDSRSAASE
jgi:hypothetical protein